MIQAQNDTTMSYQKPVFVKIKKAIQNQKTKGEFFLSATDMLKILAEMENCLIDLGYEKILQDYIISKGFDQNKVSDKNTFIDPAQSYVNNFRETKQRILIF